MAASNSSPKRQRSGVDKITDLPDSVLVHILSFLPTRNVVATGILSKRWQFLWRIVPCFNFEDNGRRPGGMTFTNFVNRVLFETTVGSFRKFKVKCDSTISATATPYDIESWIRNAVYRNVEELDIDFPPYYSFYLPQTIFACKRLVVLKLCGTINIIPQNLPCFPHLKSLELNSVRFQDDKSFNNLISCCFVLENLSVQIESAAGVKEYFINTPELKSLKIKLLYSKKLEINAPKLQDLHVRLASGSITLTKFGSLVKANVHFVSISTCQSFFNCFDALNNVKDLSLFGYELQDFDFQAGIQTINFPNLTHLTLGGRCVWRSWLPYFLQCFEKLEVLRLEEEKTLWDASNYVLIEPEAIPRCLSSHLRVVQITGFREEYAYGLLKYVLKNGKVLEIVKLSHRIEAMGDNAKKRLLGLEVKYEAAQKILALPRGSGVCEVKLC